MKIRRAAALAVGGYLIGSISFARLIGRRVAANEDLSQNTLNLPGGATVEYGGVSATSIAIRGGPTWGVITGVLDMAKAFVPTLVVRRRWPDEPYHLVVAVASVVGHNYPVYHRFRGGRGQTPLYGSLLAVDWPALPITTTVGSAIGLLVFRDMYVAYWLGTWLLIPWFGWRAGLPEVAYATAGNLLLAIAGIPETKRYFERRRAGELQQVSSWRELMASHPAVRGRGGPSPSSEDGG